MMLWWEAVAAGSIGGAFATGIVAIILGFHIRHREVKSDQEIRALVGKL